MRFVAALVFIGAATTASADDLVLEVPSTVDAVVLECGGQRLEQAVASTTGATALVRFPQWPGRSCDVTFVQRVGQVIQLGDWRCGADGCAETHANEAAAPPLPPGQVKVLLTEGLPHQLLELTCPGGFRQRTSVRDHAALFTGVPSEDCEVFFKGGAPLRFRPVREGTWECSVVSATAVCRAR